MRVPVLSLRGILIASVQGVLTDTDLMDLQTELAQQVGARRAHGVLLDLTPLDVLDSYATRTLRDMAQTARLRGAEMVIVGIQPEVALTMVQLGLRLEGVTTALDLEQGYHHLEQVTRGVAGHAR